jgi:sulfide:quinone oxidoreductase
MSTNAASSGNTETFDVVVIGGGAAGIGVTASLLRRRSDLRIAIIEPSDRHFYQPAWTLVQHRRHHAADVVRDA